MIKLHYARFLTLLATAALILGTAFAAQAQTESFTVKALPDRPGDPPIVALGSHGQTLIAVAGDGMLYTLRGGEQAWSPGGRADSLTTLVTAVGTPSGLVLIARDLSPMQPILDVTQPIDGVTLLLADNGLSIDVKPLPARPGNSAPAAAAAIGDTVYLLVPTSASDDPDATVQHACYTLDLTQDEPAWTEAPDLALAGPALKEAALLAFGGNLYVFGVGPDGAPRGYRVATNEPDRRKGWRSASPPPAWAAQTSSAPYGDAHLFVMLGGDEAGETDNTLLAYHTITDRWIEVGQPDGMGGGVALMTSRGGLPVVVAGSKAVTLTPEATPPSFGWLDRGVVLIYLAGMVGIGFYFTRREGSTSDYFRGGQRVPWWASGMSLFATYASAITIMSMPAMSYSTNWTYYAIGICEIAALPVAVFFLVPLIRRLKISTSNEYLERRFGLAARVIGSIIFMLMQIGARMASVMLLPAIALSAITGVDIVVCILVMGVIATLYTFLGGLEAVVWTDTVQGFVMVGTVLACLGLVFYKLSTPADQAVDALMADDKLHTFETSWSLAYPTLWIFLVYSMTMVMLRLADQNFVQRVQCTPTMKQAKLAVCTQLLVALPLNALLFAVGTALWLFYRDTPGALDPTIKTDSIYPFFAAQQMPAGISGLIVAALLAATMSTISSSICSVSDLGVNDFYKRFRQGVTDQQALVLGRVLTASVGLLGMGAAIVLSMLSSDQIWDVFILVTNLISNGIVGLFLLGLLSKRANEAGALFGFACGMAVVIWLQITGQQISVFLYIFIGSVITFVFGYLASLVLPGRRKPLAGLTVYTLHEEHEPTDGAPLAGDTTA